MEQIGQPLTFAGWFEDSDGAGLSGIIVTVDVRDPSGNLVVNNQAATDDGGGHYGYAVAGADNDQAGVWKAVFKTVSASAAKLHWPDAIRVGADWVENVDARVSTLATASALEAVDDFLDTEITAIKAATDQLVSAQAELSGVPAANATPLEKLNWVFTRMRNRRTQTSTTETIYKDDGGTALATSTKSDNGSVLTAGKFS